jgi:hypothetical protein
LCGAGRDDVFIERRDFQYGKAIRGATRVFDT